MMTENKEIQEQVNKAIDNAEKTIISCQIKSLKERIEQVVPMLTDEYHLYGVASLIKDLCDCVSSLLKIIEEQLNA